MFFTESDGCANPQWTTDEFCDDVTNTVECDYDGGACCWAMINDDYCNECICHSDGTRHPSANSAPGKALFKSFS